jgi:hypothetical protein
VTDTATQPWPGIYAEPADWQDELFRALGVAHPTAADREFFAAWFREEHGAGLETGASESGLDVNPVTGQVSPESTDEHGGAFNPFDTSLPEPGSTTLNPAGVQSYPTAAEGYEATVDTLEHSDPAYGYAPIVAGLRGGASLTQLERAEAASSWGNAFPAYGPVTSAKAEPGKATSIGGRASGIAEEFAAGIVSSFRDLLEMLAGVGLIVLGFYMIARDLDAAGVPITRATRSARRALSPTRRRTRRATRATTEARTETARTRVAETRAAREHVGRRTEAATRAAEERTAKARAVTRQERARARQEEEAARVLKASGSAAGGSTPAAKRHERERTAEQRAEYRRRVRARTYDTPYNERAGRAHAPAAGYENEPPF